MGPANVETRTVLIFGRHDASVSLYFDAMPASGIALRFRSSSSPRADRAAMAEADGVVLVRSLDRFAVDGTLAFLARAGIPYLYFVDDSFFTLRRDEPSFWAYSRERYRKMLAGTGGVLVTSPALAEEFAPLHPRVATVGLCLDRNLLQKSLPWDEEGDDIRAAIPGGCFRDADFRRSVAPALAALARERSVTLLARETCDFTGLGFPTVPMRLQHSFPLFVQAWLAERPTVLLHPRAATANDRYKTPNALLVALYLGVPLVVAAGEPAYDGFDEADGVLRATTDADWQRQIADAHKPHRRRALIAALGETCHSRFTGHEQAAALRAFLATWPPVDVETIARRRVIAAAMPIPLLAAASPRGLRNALGRTWHRLRRIHG